MLLLLAASVIIFVGHDVGREEGWFNEGSDDGADPPHGRGLIYGRPGAYPFGKFTARCYCDVSFDCPAMWHPAVLFWPLPLATASLLLRLGYAKT